MLEPKEGEKVVAVVPEYASGPGWTNEPLWVYVEDRGSKIRRFCLQPNEQTLEVRLLFRVCEAAHTAMISAVRDIVNIRWNEEEEGSRCE